jgi:hypothetical protein
MRGFVILSSAVLLYHNRLVRPALLYIPVGQSHHGNLFYHYKQMLQNHNRLSLRDPVRMVFPQWVEAISDTVENKEEDCHAKTG